MKDFYYILGTDSRCTAGEINEAYRKLAQKLGPASHENDHFLQSHFREITEAYEILSDPNRRRTYDAAFKKTHQRHLANFKTRPINIALTGALILFTTLFGFYVVRLLNTSKPAEVVRAAVPVVAIPQIKPHKARHYKKRLYTRVAPPVVTKPTVKDTAQVKIAKSISVKSNPAVISSPPIIAPVVKQAAIVTPIDSSYTAYLKPNLAGSVYLHQLADYMSAVVTLLPSNAKVRVLAQKQSFYKIAFNNQVGYVPKWTIAKP
ncbi:SH3 domain-containing protein [Mucilaginibacter polytrichastri]|uniref:J domain-containing protein n=1 Tax=Mucilaginibacter polytrichastri TaxID=1302689 RepID=A0A1Q6A2I0_9SPHI|nr:SH3 domain-containing protein [Mucilaginibacter polytrichastri]OKS88216.1 hypothetical protein RG47T_3680 [Mucilaginibacter polytrichastri]SFT08195.1 DnaJ domain-containing protein [Mucilaginibacter polytrichastri]